MTSEQQLQASDEIVEKVQAGTLLKNKRESLGLSQKQIADRLRLRVSIIENIESNNFTSDQVATFTRGYLRSYARAVGIAESEVLCALDGCEETQPEEQEMKSFSHKTKREAHDSRIMTLTLGIVIVVLGISSVWWWQNQEKSMESLTDQTDQEIQLEQATENQPLDFTTLTEAELEPAVGEDAIEALDSTPAPVIEEVVSSEPVTTEIVEETQPVQAVPVSETKEVVKPEPVEETATTEQPAVANLLVMSFSDDCWIQVKDASGKTLSTGVKKAGQSLNLSGNLPYSVILGAPENVSMTLASEPVDLSGYTSGKVARFNLP
ncbi:cytoskeleton protein RodZ [Vibrio europaeus]|uniref:cytoskeleton protein RodZ n=1 Tax=Vibrio europaeus TaxID=300876 RepID=UPI00233EECBA|nr:cytoskeleton protein RodZ [Vibrio europaeus]MDC5803823.1 cytoskeleton protein RodZ [Vibrio europaeus]MDC5822970.1 cytoskeleton protein RodZ [Vibrio europaeus]MDC5823696.1 cytoskeleton protein RodZ [Vibrio europaeus]MDC5828468.1 cytoskeleton protein RodZ [Vibrio europaeus]MDC5833428.1 cytoskeleton protein RodZ [Vibrio europaeus]